MTKYRAWYEKVYRNSKFDGKNMERSETSTTVWPCSKTEPVSPLSVCGDYLEHFRGILDVQEYNINTIQINIGFGWIWCTGYLSKNVLCQTCSTTVSVESMQFYETSVFVLTFLIVTFLYFLEYEYFHYFFWAIYFPFFPLLFWSLHVFTALFFPFLVSTRLFCTFSISCLYFGDLYFPLLPCTFLIFFVLGTCPF